MIKEGCLYLYNKGQGWCKHGIVYTVKHQDQLFAIDTYWDSNMRGRLCSDITYYLVDDELAKDLEFVMALEDIKDVSRDEWFLYPPKDRVYLPMGGWHERWIVNKNSEKVRERVIEELEYTIAEKKSKMKYLEIEIKKLEKELEEMQ